MADNTQDADPWEVMARAVSEDNGSSQPPHLTEELTPNLLLDEVRRLRQTVDELRTLLTPKEGAKSPGKYPWGVWLDGNTHMVTQGKDFAVSVQQFQTFLGNTARRKGLYMLTSLQRDGQTIVFHAYKTEEERDRARRGLEEVN